MSKIIPSLKLGRFFIPGPVVLILGSLFGVVLLVCLIALAALVVLCGAFIALAILACLLVLGLTILALALLYGGFAGCKVLFPSVAKWIAAFIVALRMAEAFVRQQSNNSPAQSPPTFTPRRTTSKARTRVKHTPPHHRKRRPVKNGKMKLQASLRPT